MLYNWLLGKQFITLNSIGLRIQNDHFHFTYFPTKLQKSRFRFWRLPSGLGHMSSCNRNCWGNNRRCGCNGKICSCSTGAGRNVCQSKSSRHSKLQQNGKIIFTLCGRRSDSNRYRRSGIYTGLYTIGIAGPINGHIQTTNHKYEIGLFNNWMFDYFSIFFLFSDQALNISLRLGASRILIVEDSTADIFQKIILNVSVDDLHFALNEWDPDYSFLY